MRVSRNSIASTFSLAAIFVDEAFDGEEIEIMRDGTPVLDADAVIDVRNSRR